MAAPVLALAIRVHPYRGLEWPRRQFALPRPARIDAGLIIVQINHAAAVERIALRAHGKRQELLDVAAPGVGGGAQAVSAGQRLIQHQSELILAHRFAGVELVRGGDRLRGIGVPLRPGQAQRILRARRVEMVEHQIQRALACEIDTELAVERRPPCRAVIAIAIGIEHTGREVVVHPAPRARPACAQRAGGVTAGRGLHALFARCLAARAGQLHDAARGIAVQRRERTAQHFHPLGAHQVEMRQLALSVRQRGGNAIRIQPHAAHAEGRACAEAADRQLGVLCVVLPVARQQARYAAEPLGQIDAGGGGVLAQVDQIERGRRVERGHRIQAGRLHGDAIQRARVLREQWREREQREGDGERQRGAGLGIHAPILGGPGYTSPSASQPSPVPRVNTRSPSRTSPAGIASCCARRA